MGSFVAGNPGPKPVETSTEPLKDACGRVIQVGDKLIYGTASGVNAANAAVVIEVSPQLKVRIISQTEYGTVRDKEVLLGRRKLGNDVPLLNVIIFEAQGKLVDFAERVHGIQRRER